MVKNNVNLFARLRLNAEVFSSYFSKRYINSSNILVRFVLDNNTTDTYPDQVQFFFEHTIQLPEGSVTHSLAFIR